MQSTGAHWSIGANAGGATHFEVWPHRATSPRGFRILATSVGAVMFAVAAVPGWYGLWPVSVIVVASYAFFVAAFVHNARAARFAEVIDIAPRALIIQTQSRAGGPVTHSTFDPHWARVDLGSDYYVENRLRLCQSERSVEIGRFLAPEERVELARALSEAIGAVRSSRGCEASSGA